MIHFFKVPLLAQCIDKQYLEHVESMKCRTMSCFIFALLLLGSATSGSCTFFFNFPNSNVLRLLVRWCDSLCSPERLERLCPVFGSNSFMPSSKHHGIPPYWSFWVSFRCNIASVTEVKHELGTAWLGHGFRRRTAMSIVWRLFGLSSAGQTLYPASGFAETGMS